MFNKVKEMLYTAFPVLVLCGCLSQEPSSAKSWLISATRKNVSELNIDKISKLGAITVAAPYDRPALAVKRKDGSIAFDAYNVFASSPSALLRAPLAAILEDDGRFGRVLSSVSTARYGTSFEVVVTDISLDCRQAGKRTAVVSLSIAIIENREIKMFLDGKGSADAASGDYSAAFSEAFSNAVIDALKAIPSK